MPPTARKPRRSDSLETQMRILDAAEALFIEQGFVATSVRAIANRAGVNLAAAHYHFGSKEGLLGATFHRRVEPLNATRIEALDALEAHASVPTVRDLMRAFLEPLAGVDPESALPRLVGRLYGEPDSVARPLVEREFSEIAERFYTALRTALPEVAPEIVHWRFHFVVGAMIHLLSFEKPPVPIEPLLDPSEGLEQLIEFAASGLDPDNTSRRSPRSNATS
ncbi:MAG: TetR/AcrR family transcriptional regulator [bacterium]|nr:TetR/AcrR family transcriptional regulator [bacterium]MCP5043922.1 TetR/AcrR family transcriptional regulator [bacterium]